MNTISKFFHLKENNTSFKTELLAGLTTFVSMSYILFVNPNVLGASGMDKGALFTVNCSICCFYLYRHGSPSKLSNCFRSNFRTKCILYLHSVFRNAC